MSRAMNEGLEGLVLKDINVMWQIDLLTALQVCMLISKIAALECNYCITDKVYPLLKMFRMI